MVINDRHHLAGLDPGIQIAVFVDAHQANGAASERACWLRSALLAALQDRLRWRRELPADAGLAAIEVRGHQAGNGPISSWRAAAGPQQGLLAAGGFTHVLLPLARLTLAEALQLAAAQQQDHRWQ